MKIALLCVVLLTAGVLGQREKWDKLEKANGNALFSFRVALPQANLDVLEAALLDVSSPRSPNYAQWWTLQKIQELVAPAPEITNRVISFFSSPSHNMTIVNYKDSLKVTGLVQDIEQIFQTELYKYMHRTEYAAIVRADGGYTIPDAIKADVEFVAGLLEFPDFRSHQVRSASTEVKADIQAYVVPAVINNLYQIPANFPVHPNSSLCLAEFQADQAILYSDLANFTSENDITPFNVTHVIGPFNGTNAESTLDVEYGAAIAQKAPIWFWTEEVWMYEFGVDLVGTPNPPLVVSMSWGWPEPLQCSIDDCSNFDKSSEQYVARTNTEFQKAGLLGITLLAASGDQGAPGDGNPDCSFLKKKKLSTIFPGASPWVLSVGATMLNDSTVATFPLPPVCNDHPCTNFTTEEVCTYPDALITTGGGFSNYVPIPSYQASVVNTYLTTSGAQLPPYKYFNMSNRGFPDVSAIGHNYLIMMDANWYAVDGTSCSTPVWGGIISLLNSYRLNNNKTPLGFVVPLIYEAYATDPTIFNDITSGNNKCTESCCDHYGYEAVKGWDPVTGLGTPVFPKLLKYVASLP